MSFLAKLQEDCQLMPNGNFEFSWIEREYNGINLMPKVRHQVDESCVFQAICAGTEMAIKRNAALRSPPAISDIEFNTSSFVKDYENHTDRKIGDESSQDLPVDVREETAITLFRNNGVLATSNDWEGEQRVKSQCLKQRLLQFDRIADHIKNARPVVGSFPVDRDFLRLGPDEIYEYRGNSREVDYSHMVLFVGYGFEGGLDGKKYLIFMNSYGEEFGDRGFGRVYFADIFRDRLYVMYATAPRIIQDPNVSTSAHKREPTQDHDDRPAQRLRLSGDDSSVGGQHPRTLPGD